MVVGKVANEKSFAKLFKQNSIKFLMPKKDLEFVKKVQKEITLLSNASALLGWDQQVYMPKKASQDRAEQATILDGILHKKITDDKFYKAVLSLSKSKLPNDDARTIEILKRDLGKARKLPNEFIEELSKTTSQAFDAWQEARERKDFKIFLPHLKKIVELKKKQAKYIGLAGHTYNSLLDSFEEGMTVEELKPKFEKLKIELIELIKKIENSEKYKTQKNIFENYTFSNDKQIIMSKEIAEKIGLKKDISRVDISTHPFTIRLGTKDVRITTNVRTDPLFSLLSTMHEAGHALYEIQMPEKFKYTALMDTPSLGIHESQSRFWENMVGRNKPFWKYYSKQFKSEFGLKEKEEEIFSSVNHIFPGKIRIESDEVHYCLHVILRFEIEIDLIAGKISVEELPKIWNNKMKELFGVTPKNDAEGVLQDVHWSGGSFGYFPTYALGTIYASQIYEQMKKEIPKIEEEIEKGNFEKMQKWLGEKIHSQGRKYLAEDLIKKVCGEGLNPEVYIKYLTKKFSEIYGF